MIDLPNWALLLNPFETQLFAPGTYCRLWHTGNVACSCGQWVNITALDPVDRRETTLSFTGEPLPSSSNGNEAHCPPRTSRCCCLQRGRADGNPSRCNDAVRGPGVVPHARKMLCMTACVYRQQLRSRGWVGDEVMKHKLRPGRSVKTNAIGDSAWVEVWCWLFSDPEPLASPNLPTRPRR